MKDTEDQNVGNMALLLAVLAYTDPGFARLIPYFPLTQELWERCLWVCILEENMEQYKQLWSSYPQFVDSMMREFEETAATEHRLT